MKNCILILTVISLLSGCSRNVSTRPNILVFLADDLGYGDLGCYGNPIIKTPHMDKLATEGVRMTDCHSGGTVCSPSRAALLTGRNPYRSGFFYIAGRDTHLQADEKTIAEQTYAEMTPQAKWRASSTGLGIA